MGKPVDDTAGDMTALGTGSAGLADCPSWPALRAHALRLAKIPLATLLDEPGRFQACSRAAGQLLLDFSRQRLDGRVLGSLLALAEERQLPAWREALFSGAVVNNTENRPALHMALRDFSGGPLLVAGQDVMPEIATERARMLALAEAIRGGSFRGQRGAPIRQVVNIGIGGSDLGLVMAAGALAGWQHPDIQTHFVSNIDGGELAQVLARAEPDSTLFVICSKTFTTLETRLNAEVARRWLTAALGEAAVARHFVAVSTNAAAMDAFGIAPELRLCMWDWVGGRYSLWGPIGLTLAITIGAEAFTDMLRGAERMDRHFRAAAAGENLPVLLALLGIWNQNHLGCTSHAVLPYDSRLARFPAFLQQLEMESNGKRVTRDGQPVDWTTGTVLWGEAASNAQHSFFQLLHQGTSRFSLDFLAPVQDSSGYPDQHREGLANLLAQAETFARGYQPADGDGDPGLAAHRTHPGNHPSSILLFPRLDPGTLGQLIALYEHKVFVQAVIWGINPFDQWGVERGKQLAREFGQVLAGTAPAEGAPGLVDAIRRWRR
jgi:glucose-6-phosphate isomerase